MTRQLLTQKWLLQINANADSLDFSFDMDDLELKSPHEMNAIVSKMIRIANRLWIDLHVRFTEEQHNVRMRIKDVALGNLRLEESNQNGTSSSAATAPVGIAEDDERVLCKFTDYVIESGCSDDFIKETRRLMENLCLCVGRFLLQKRLLSDQDAEKSNQTLSAIMSLPLTLGMDDLWVLQGANLKHKLVQHRIVKIRF